MSIDSLSAIRTFIATFENLARAGTLSHKEILEAWQREQQLGRRYAHRQPEIDEAPAAFRHELTAYPHHRDEIWAELDRWNPSFCTRLPLVIEWAVQTRHDEVGTHLNLDLLKAVVMDHAAFLSEILRSSEFSWRLLFAFLEHPALLELLPEEERWSELKKALMVFGTAASWHWADYAAHYWSRERTQALIYELIEEKPEIASAFLLSSLSHVGWLAFDTVDALEDIFYVAAVRAPIEAFQAKAWMCTCLGDRLANPGASFMTAEESCYWPNDIESFQQELAPVGLERYQRIEQVALHALERSMHEKSSELSRTSNAVRERLLRFYSSRELEAKDVIPLVEALLELPESAFGLRLVKTFFHPKPSADQALWYRLAQKVQKRLSRAHVLVRGPSSAWRPVENINGQRDPILNWIEPAMRRILISLGWKFAPVELRRNTRYDESSGRGYSPQVRIESARGIHVYNVWRGYCSVTRDFYRDRPTPQVVAAQEVLIAPDFNPGQPAYQKGGLFIYEVGTKLPLAEPLAHDRAAAYLS